MKNAQRMQQKAQQQQQQMPAAVLLEKLEAKAPAEQKSIVERTREAVDVQLVHTTQFCEGLKLKTMTIVKNPDFKTSVVATTSGTVAFGAVGGAFGTASGVLVGSAVGLPAALFTLGFSIPVGAAMCGAGGFVIGSGVGAVAGGAGSCATYKYRVEIKEGIVVVKVKAMDAVNATKVKAIAFKDRTLETAAHYQARAALAIEDTKTKVSHTARSTRDTVGVKAGEALTFATTTRAGVASTTAVGGGAIGGAAGGCTGTLLGAAVGVVPALFTFGLSIPIGATIGLCCGTVAGGTTGVAAGGAVGYGGYTYRKELGDAKAKIGEKAGQARTMAASTVSRFTQSARARCGTGGSESAEAEA